MVAANFIAVAARMSLVTFLGIYFVRKAGIDARHGRRSPSCARTCCAASLAPMFGALSRPHRAPAAAHRFCVATAAVLPCFLLVDGPRDACSPGASRWA